MEGQPPQAGGCPIFYEWSKRRGVSAKMPASSPALQKRNEPAQITVKVTLMWLGAPLEGVAVIVNT